MGNALKDQGKLLLMVEVFYNKALSLKPDYAEAYNMGNVFKDQGKLDEAIEACNKAPTIRPDYAEAHGNLSFAFLNVGDLKKGLEEYEWRLKNRKTRQCSGSFQSQYGMGKKILRANASYFGLSKVSETL